MQLQLHQADQVLRNKIRHVKIIILGTHNKTSAHDV